MNKRLYRWGVQKEYYLVKELKKKGYDIVQRSAGSKSPIDIFAIDSKKKIILLVQSKRVVGEHMSFVDSDLKDKIEDELNHLNGVYDVEVVVK